MARAPRIKRYEARLLPEQLQRIRTAAEFEGLSLTDFIVKYADEAAARAIEWHTSWALEQRDRDEFVKAIFRTPDPIALEEPAPDINLEAAQKWL